MTVLRIVCNIAAPDVDKARAFYGDLLGLRLVMDQGWIQTYAGAGAAAPQISIPSKGGSGAPVPDMSIEVDNLEAIHERVVASRIDVEYGPVSEPWGVRRFFVRDPFGRLVNILAHAAS